MTQAAIAVERLKSAPRLLAIGAIALYRAALSPMIHALNGPACRFEPSCSEYARGAIAEYGLVRGGALAAWRIARCNPLGGHGYDPVRHSLASCAQSRRGEQE
jgi:putative membrane protein insertion efficiency factor